MNETKTPVEVSDTGCCGPSCCGGQETSQATGKLTATIREKYGSVASSTLSNSDEGVRKVAEAFG
jgi:hypothetical protein